MTVHSEPNRAILSDFNLFDTSENCLKLFTSTCNTGAPLELWQVCRVISECSVVVINKE